MPLITTRDDTDLYVKQWGQEGRDIVLVHGWPLNADSWDDVALPLAQAGYRVTAYDRRGFGRSDQPFDGYDYDIFADDLADIMEAADVEDALLVGFSMGGGEVARYLSRHEKAGVSKVALISSVVPFMRQTADNPDGAPAKVFEDMKAGIRDDRAGFMQSFAPQFFGNGWIAKAVSDGVLDSFFQMAMLAGLWPTLAWRRCLLVDRFPQRHGGVQPADAHHPRHRRPHRADRHQRASGHCCDPTCAAGRL